MNDNITKSEFVIEQYTLILKHELIDNGKPFQIEEPIIARCVFPLSDQYMHNIQARPYILDKVITDLVRAVRDRAMEVE